MSDFEVKLAEARERILNRAGAWTGVDYGFDAATAVALEVVAEKDAEIVSLGAVYESACRRANALRERLNVAESREVSDAQRKRIAERLMPSVGVVLAYCLADDIIAIIKEQPAAEDAPKRNTFLEDADQIRLESEAYTEQREYEYQQRQRERRTASGTKHPVNCDCGGFDRNGSHDAGEYVGYCAQRDILEQPREGE